MKEIPLWNRRALCDLFFRDLILPVLLQDGSLPAYEPLHEVLHVQGFL